jgi:hypothetical protein
MELSNTRPQSSKEVAAGLSAFGIELPQSLATKITVSYHGMLPLERFAKETCGIVAERASFRKERAIATVKATMSSRKERGPCWNHGTAIVQRQAQGYAVVWILDRQAV